jgi:hypothetical protein
MVRSQKLDVMLIATFNDAQQGSVHARCRPRPKTEPIDHFMCASFRILKCDKASAKIRTPRPGSMAGTSRKMACTLRWKGDSRYLTSFGDFGRSGHLEIAELEFANRAFQTDPSRVEGPVTTVHADFDWRLV